MSAIAMQSPAVSWMFHRIRFLPAVHRQSSTQENPIPSGDTDNQCMPATSIHTRSRMLEAPITAISSSVMVDHSSSSPITPSHRGTLLEGLKDTYNELEWRNLPRDSSQITPRSTKQNTPLSIPLLSVHSFILSSPSPSKHSRTPKLYQSLQSDYETASLSDDEELAISIQSFRMDFSPSPAPGPLRIPASRRLPPPSRPRFEMVIGSRQEIYNEKVELPDVFGPNIDTERGNLIATGPEFMDEMFPESSGYSIGYIGNRMLRSSGDHGDSDSDQGAGRAGSSASDKFSPIVNPNNGTCQVHSMGAISIPRFIRHPGINITPRARSKSTTRRKGNPNGTCGNGVDFSVGPNKRSDVLGNVTGLVFKDGSDGSVSRTQVSPLNSEIWYKRGRSRELKPIQGW